MSQPSHFVPTMPEAKFRSTKNRDRRVRAIRASEQHHEARTFGPQLVKARPAVDKAEVALPENVTADRRKKVDRRKEAFSIASFWPVAVGIFLAGFAPEWHAMAAQAGIWAMRMTFPLTLLAAHREIGIDAQMASMLPTFALYAQFPLDGVLTMLTLARSRSLKAAIVQLALVHGICTLVLWLISTSIA